MADLNNRFSLTNLENSPYPRDVRYGQRCSICGGECHCNESSGNAIQPVIMDAVSLENVPDPHGFCRVIHWHLKLKTSYWPTLGSNVDVMFFLSDCSARQKIHDLDQKWREAHCGIVKVAGIYLDMGNWDIEVSGPSVLDFKWSTRWINGPNEGGQWLVDSNGKNERGEQLIKCLSPVP